jgi:hypothetical protein
MKRTYLVSIFVLLFFATICHAKQLNVLNLAKEFGFASSYEIDKLKNTIHLIQGY